MLEGLDPDAPVCDECGQRIIYVLCRRNGRSTPEGQAALRDIIVAMHKKLAHDG